MRPTEYVQGTQEKYYKYKTSIDQKERVIIYLVSSSTDVSFIMVLYIFLLSNKLNLFENVIAGLRTT